jgi:hypothetical protein
LIWDAAVVNIGDHPVGLFSGEENLDIRANPVGSGEGVDADELPGVLDMVNPKCQVGRDGEVLESEIEALKCNPGGGGGSIASVHGIRLLFGRRLGGRLFSWSLLLLVLIQECHLLHHSGSGSQSAGSKLKLK